MKPFLKTVMLFCIITIALTNGPVCKNPDEYNPDVDSLLPPPAPPNPLTPPDDFVHMPNGTNRLLISWEHIEDAEIYEINFVGENHNEWKLKLDTTFIAQNWMNTNLFDKYTWKVRAYSSKWEYYTNWSEPWHFEVRFPFDPPAPLYPPNDTILYFDSLPAFITLQWTEITGAQFYYYRVFMDTTLLFECLTYTNYGTISIAMPGNYYWDVKAGSELWEFDTNWSVRYRFLVISNKS
ncbi:MAG: hypothetical protein ABIL18_05960 [candidate division WOR-3 bacterium]